MRGDFAGVHVCPETNADIPDTDEARLVILHPKVAHKSKTESEAKAFTQKATEHRGSAGVSDLLCKCVTSIVSREGDSERTRDERCDGNCGGGTASA
jgi:hypothetical protein